MTRAPALLASLGIACVAVLGSAPTAIAAEKVTYLLPAPITLPAFGPWVVAQQRGYYAAEDLEVSFQTANGGADVAKQVGVGNAVIGGATGDTSIIVRGNGVPVKSVALLGGGGLTLLVVPEGSAIKGPADLKGKVVTVSGYQQTTYYQLLGMLAKVGLSKSDVDIQAPGPAGVWKLFLARQADAMAGVPDFLAEAERNGMKVRVYPSQDYFRSMAQAILASDTTIAKRPELIRKLVRATLRGMKDIMDDPRAAAAYWRHRIEHQPGLWRFHATHHADEELHWLSVLRKHPVSKFLEMLVDSLPVLLLGFPAWSILAAQLIRSWWGYFIHADVPWTLGMAGRWLISPAAHRLHHIRDETLMGSNYGNMLTLWDRLFGTWRDPAPHLHCATGIAEGTRGLWGELKRPWEARYRQPAEQREEAAA